MNIQEFENKAETAATLLKALASRPRLMILCNLVDGEQSVGQLAEQTGMRMAAVSQNLALLRAEKVVVQRRVGTTIYYSLANEVVREVIGVLYRAFCEPAPRGRKR